MLALGVVAGIGVLWFGYYTLSPSFRTIAVNEALPESNQQTEEQSDVAVPTEIEEDAQPEQEVVAVVVGTTGHPASGTARIVSADGKHYVRYENFKTINGPDLYVYLSKDLEATDFVNLGVLKATEGNVNYEIPSGVDVADYRYVVTWCKQFGVLFNHADIASTR